MPDSVPYSWRKAARDIQGHHPSVMVWVGASYQRMTLGAFLRKRREDGGYGVSK